MKKPQQFGKACLVSGISVLFLLSISCSSKRAKLDEKKEFSETSWLWPGTEKEFKEYGDSFYLTGGVISIKPTFYNGYLCLITYIESDDEYVNIVLKLNLEGDPIWRKVIEPRSLNDEEIIEPDDIDIIPTFTTVRLKIQ